MVATSGNGLRDAAKKCRGREIQARAVAFIVAGIWRAFHTREPQVDRLADEMISISDGGDQKRSDGACGDHPGRLACRQCTTSHSKRCANAAAPASDAKRQDRAAERVDCEMARTIGRPGDGERTGGEAVPS